MKNIFNRVSKQIVDKKYLNLTQKKFRKLIKKNAHHIVKAVVALAKEEGISDEDLWGSLFEVLSCDFLDYDIDEAILYRYELFLVADALGCDDLELRKKYKDLQAIYEIIWGMWGELTILANKIDTKENLYEKTH